MQVKYGFKKEWLQFTRTFRLGGILLGILSFSIADPLMYWALNLMMNTVMTSMGSVGATGTDAIAEVADIFGDASLVFSGTMAEFCSTSLLIVMLVLMSPCGGEQKKRATIIPSCAGLEFSSYLIPKYVLYPGTVFAASFVACCISGGLCNALFSSGKVEFGMILLAALMCAVFMTFYIVVYMSIGLCSSRPGVVTVLMYIGISLVQIILTSLDLTKFHPLTLRSLVTGEMFAEDFVLADNVASIAVGIALSVVIGVMMYILTLTVLKGTKINNQEDKPEF
ncbi:MAG: hypothetical protein ACI4RK_08505 [Oscillospiraceae bacterium]